ncbi:focadhesin-like isoform X1 [Myxocyprinus asiaticus]|uniref:focadhesin-like isoform X1 n=2 Tax=Myxocyprinus asiaticus TaxID=70543 RepID=UPI0022225800|nr:focadhesin-like isoform X1 [Myxocyprinus asiaticus]
MTENLKTRFEFPSSLIQAQAVRTLVAAVLKEKGQNERICQSSTKSLALESLWEQCSSDSTVVRSACCDALVLLVEQGHADLQYVLNTTLNLLPSARNVQGLIKVVGRLLQIQASQRNTDANFTCPYSIRSFPHPYITVLENRPDCWPALLQEIDDFIQLASDKDEPVFVEMLSPFLRYLYCEPQRLSENALLRHSLLRVLLMPRGATQSDSQQGKGTLSTRVVREMIRSLCNLLPYMLVDSVTAVVEFSSFAESLTSALLTDPGFWRKELTQLALQLLCACQLSVQLGGELMSLLHTLHQLIPANAEDIPSEQVIMGISLLLLKASTSQQTALLELAVKIVPPEISPPWGASLLVMPLLQVLSCSTLMEALTDTQIHMKNLKLANSLLQMVQREPSIRKENSTQLTLPFSTWYSELQVATSVLHRISMDSMSAVEWLYSLQSSLSVCEHVPDTVCLLVSHLIISSHGDLCRLALDAAAAIAESDPAKVPGLLPVLMFKLGRVSDSALSHSVLYTVPRLGTHKFCIPQVLHVLQTLGSSPRLRPVALRLLALLWQKQDRVYPDLQRLMSQLERSSVVIGKETQWEQILARAACVRDICRERPYQHGGDMLAAITDTLTQFSRKDQATPVALALQGLLELCRAEVVDIRSTWKALSPKLCCDTRPLVLNVTAELLALIPALNVKTEEYEKFRNEAVNVLWGYALSQDPEVASHGFKALSEFPEPSHTILHLPEQARPVPKQPDSEDEGEENENEEKDEDISVPGASYVKLVRLTARPVLAALETFLTALVRQEMSQMPRGVYHSALSGGNLRSDQGKTVSGIPSFMLKTYEKNKQPGLKPGLAAGLLLCYDLPVQTDKDGRPITRFLVSRGRSYQQMLATLIHEVNIQPSEWHRSLLLPQAWRGFMSRAYHAVLQGRKAELEMLQKQGKESPEELQYKQHCAWLWVRDKLTDVVKSAAKDSPVVQGNSILALSGLAVVLTRYESNLPAQSESGPEVGPDILPTAHWLSMVIDTLLSIVSSNSNPKGQVFPWFIHRSYSGENTASVIARSCAALGLALLVPVLVMSRRESVPAILGTLAAGLPGSPTADESQAVQFHGGLTLGMFLAWLHDERVSDISGQSVTELLMKHLEPLEACTFNHNLEYNAGCVLGVGLVLSSLSCSSQSERDRAHVSLTLDKLLQTLQDSSSMGRMLQEVLAYSVACVGVSAFSSGIIEAIKAEEIMNTLRSLTEESQQTPGFALALGLTVYGLSSCGHGKAVDIQPRLLAAWTKILLAEGCPTMQRLSALNGLIALVGSETALIQLKSESEQSSQQQGRLNEVIRAITQIITFSGTIGLQSNGACLLGHLHLAHMSSSQSRTAVPQDFGYLPEKSVIRASVDFITEAGRKGPEFTPPHLVKTVLAALGTVGGSFQYPPVNWSAILSPLMRLNFGEEVQHHCLELAASQVQSSQSASLFLGIWLAPPLVHSLSLRTRAHLYKCLSCWMKHVAEDKLQVYVDSLAAQQFDPDTRPQRLPLCLSILHGLSKAMTVPNPPQNCWTTLCSTTEKIYNLLPDNIQAGEVHLYEEICSCLSEMSDTEIDRIVKVTEANVEKTAFILSYLTSKGRVPLLSLNDVISTILQVGNKKQISWLLLQGLHQSRFASSPNTGVSKRMEWLLDLMGHIRNVAYGSPTVKCVNVLEGTDFLLSVFAAAVVSWADHCVPLLVGIRAQWFPWRQSSQTSELSHDLYVNPVTTELSVSSCLLGIPSSMKQLLAKEPWKSQSQKFIDWLFSITEGPVQGFSKTSILTAKANLMALRSTPEFKKKTVWTRAYGW